MERLRGDAICLIELQIGKKVFWYHKRWEYVITVWGILLSATSIKFIRKFRQFLSGSIIN